MGSVGWRAKVEPPTHIGRPATNKEKHETTLAWPRALRKSGHEEQIQGVARGSRAHTRRPVSYTHLTLPTICSV
eukprot:13345487-Alexandrium_andersonii.AAC.1